MFPVLQKGFQARNLLYIYYSDFPDVIEIGNKVALIGDDDLFNQFKNPNINRKLDIVLEAKAD